MCKSTYTAFHDQNESRISGWCKPPAAVELRRQAGLWVWIFQPSPVLPEGTDGVLFPSLVQNKFRKKKNQWGRLGKYAGIWNGNGECLNGFVFVAGELPLFCKNMATAERYLWYELFIMTHNCDYFKWFCHSAFPCLLRLNSSFCERERRARAREVTSSSPVALQAFAVNKLLIHSICVVSKVVALFSSCTCCKLSIVGVS